MAQHIETHPDYRAGRGETRTTRGVVLYDEAVEAIGVWQALYAVRCAVAEGDRVAAARTEKRIRRDVIATVIAQGGKRGRLAELAVADAEAAPVDTARFSTTACWAKFRAAERLRDLAGQDPAARLVVDTSDTCRHSVSFADECAECGV